jgi:hypothetical protein
VGDEAIEEVTEGVIEEEIGLEENSEVNFNANPTIFIIHFEMINICTYKEDGGGGGEGDWSRSSAPRGGGGGGGFGGDRGGGFGGDRGGGGFGGDRGGGYGDRGGDRGGGYNSRPTAPPAERPEHLRNLLAPRSTPIESAAPVQQPAEDPKATAGKWETVFSKSSSSDARRGGGGGYGGDRGDRGDRGGYGGDRGGYGGDRGGYGGDRGGYGGDRRGDGYSGSSGGGGGFSQQQQQQPQAPVRTPADVIIARDDGSAPVEAKKNPEADAKAAKTAARVEKERVEKERKEAAQRAKEQALQDAKERRDRSALGAKACYESGKKGTDLVAFIKETQQEVTGAALTGLILSGLEDPCSLKWVNSAEYGQAIAHLVKDNITLQVELLYEVQTHCYNHKFPKLEIKGKQTKLIDIIFRLFYANDIVDNIGFNAWADDDNDGKVPGKTDALVHSTEFISWLNEPDVDEFDEEEDDDGFDGTGRVA